MTTTAQHIDGRPIREYIGVVAADAVVSIPTRNGLSLSARNAMRRGNRDVVDEIARLAGARGATAVLNVSVAYMSIGPGRVIVSAIGTAVRL